MKAQDQMGTYYVPEGESRHMRFVAEWFGYQSGRLWTHVIVDEIESESPVLLHQYGADQLLLQLLALEPDPSDWVRLHRFEEGGWSVEVIDDYTPEGHDASEAM